MSAEQAQQHAAAQLAAGPALDEPRTVVSGVVVAGALMLTGATVGMLSGAPHLRRALRQRLVRASAAAVTYALGRLFGATVG